MFQTELARRSPRLEDDEPAAMEVAHIGTLLAARSDGADLDRPLSVDRISAQGATPELMPR